MYIFTYINILVKSNPPIPIFSFEQEYAKYQPGILVFFCRRYLAILQLSLYAGRQLPIHTPRWRLNFSRHSR